MSVLETARRLFEHHQVPALTSDLAEAGERVLSLTAELDETKQRIPWWRRAAFFLESDDKTEAEALENQLEAATQTLEDLRERHEEAMRACGQECTPIEIVFRIESAIEQLITDRKIGLTPKSGEELAVELEAIADRVMEIWLPDVALHQLLEDLQDDELREGADPDLHAFRTDERLGWAPVDRWELFSRAARDLDGGDALTVARQRLSVAKLRTDGMKDRLEELEDSVGFFDKLMPGQSVSQMARDEHKEALSEQEARLVYAVETIHHAIVKALAEHPMVWVTLSCLGAAAALRAVRARSEAALNRDGTLGSPPSAYGRGAVGACLREARDACEAAFKGLPGLVWPRRGSPPAPDDPQRGPYRVQGFVPREPAPLVKGSSPDAQRFFERLENVKLREELAWAVAHANMRGLVDFCRVETGELIHWTDRAAFWSDTDEEKAEEELEARLDWHTSLFQARSLRALQLVEHAARQDGLLRIGQGAVAMQRAAAKFGTAKGTSSSPRACPVYGKQDALSALETTRGALCDRFGCVPYRSQLIEQICLVLERGSPSPPSGAPQTAHETVQLLASALQPTEFLTLARDAQNARPIAQLARAEVRMAEEAVAFWDKINVFTDSPEEQLRDAKREEASAWEQHAHQRTNQVLALLEGALEHHPPSQLVLELWDVQSSITAMTARSQRRTRTTKVGNTTRRSTYYVCVVEGVGDARERIDRWSEHLVAGVGELPCPGDLLDEWVISELV